MRIVPSIFVLLFAISFTSCKKEKTNDTQQPSQSNPITPNGWTCITQAADTVPFYKIHATDMNLYGSTYSSLFSSTDGVTWVPNTLNQAWTVVNKGTKTYLGKTNGFFLSTDSGATWTAKNNGLTNLNVSQITTSSSGIFVSGSSKIFYSNDEGNNWTDVSITGTNSVGGIAVTNNNKLYAVQNNSLYSSIDNGSNWSVISTSVITGMTNMWIMQAAAAGNNILANTNGSVYISTNDGNTWNPIAELGIYVGLYTKGNYVIATSGNWNLKFSSDGGLTWVAYNDGLPSQRNFGHFTFNSYYVYTIENNSKKIYRRKL